MFFNIISFFQIFSPFMISCPMCSKEIMGLNCQLKQLVSAAVFMDGFLPLFKAVPPIPLLRHFTSLKRINYRRMKPDDSSLERIPNTYFSYKISSFLSSMQISDRTVLETPWNVLLPTASVSLVKVINSFSSLEENTRHLRPPGATSYLVKQIVGLLPLVHTSRSSNQWRVPCGVVTSNTCFEAPHVVFLEYTIQAHTKYIKCCVTQKNFMFVFLMFLIQFMGADFNVSSKLF